MVKNNNKIAGSIQGYNKRLLNGTEPLPQAQQIEVVEATTTVDTIRGPPLYPRAENKTDNRLAFAVLRRRGRLLPHPGRKSKRL